MSVLMVTGIVTGLAPMPRPIPEAIVSLVIGGAPKPIRMVTAVTAHLLYGGVSGAVLAGAVRPVSVWKALGFGVLLWAVLDVVFLPLIVGSLRDRDYAENRRRDVRPPPRLRRRSWVESRPPISWLAAERGRCFRLGQAELTHSPLGCLNIKRSRPFLEVDMTNVEIEYCVPCGHRNNALDTADSLLAEFGRDLDGVAVTPGHGGVFRVSVDGKVVFDKDERETGRESRGARRPLSTEHLSDGRRLRPEPVAGPNTVARPSPSRDCRSPRRPGNR